MRIALIVFIIMTFLGPVWIVLSNTIDFHANYQTANRQSAHLSPTPKQYSDAIIQVFAARAFNWRGIVSLHLWLALKPKNADAYFVCQVVGWNFFRGLPALSIAKDIPDRYWFNQKPVVIFELRGLPAEELLPKINQAIKHYPYQQTYITWPGPNSNTFIAYVAREVPDLKLALPSNAIGKDFMGLRFFAKTPSGTGYQISLFGCLGIMLALKEGLEINFLGLVYGINPIDLIIKLPGFGDINLKSSSFNLFPA